MRKLLIQRNWFFYFFLAAVLGAATVLAVPALTSAHTTGCQNVIVQTGQQAAPHPAVQCGDLLRPPKGYIWAEVSNNTNTHISAFPVPAASPTAKPAGTVRSQTSRENPPECNLVPLVEPSGAKAWVDGCGGSPSAESPWQDLAPTTGQVLMDGTTVLNATNCPRTNPCVLIWQGGPAS